MIYSNIPQSPYQVIRVTPANPAAGINLNYQWIEPGSVEIEYIHFRLITAATVALRRMVLVIDDSVGGAIVLAAPTVQAASKTMDYIFARWPQDTSSFGTAPVIAVPWPGFIINGLNSAAEINTLVQNLQAGDQISSIRIIGTRLPITL